tara:strand:- start:301 stop:510 length:210 start_codon:yes stop_codon:yes gene_type:complete
MSILNENELEKKIVSTIKERIQDSLAYRTYDRRTNKRFHQDYRKTIRDAKDFDELKRVMSEFVDDLMHI